ncbi:unnamed protein product [Gadus morhua 'NCC']
METQRKTTQPRGFKRLTPSHSHSAPVCAAKGKGLALDRPGGVYSLADCFSGRSRVLAGRDFKVRSSCGPGFGEPGPWEERTRPSSSSPISPDHLRPTRRNLQRNPAAPLQLLSTAPPVRNIGTQLDSTSGTSSSEASEGGGGPCQVSTSLFSRYSGSWWTCHPTACIRAAVAIHPHFSSSSRLPRATRDG